MLTDLVTALADAARETGAIGVVLFFIALGAGDYPRTARVDPDADGSFRLRAGLGAHGREYATTVLFGESIRAPHVIAAADPSIALPLDPSAAPALQLKGDASRFHR